MNIKTLSPLILLLTGVFMQPASAVVIFEDDFNRSNSHSVGNGWSEIERNHNDVAIHNGMLRLRDKDPGASASQLNGFSTLGLTDIMLSYEWSAPNNTEADDSLFVEWRTTGSSNWTQLIDQALGGSSLVGNVLQLGVLAANQASIEFRFYTSVSYRGEYALIDNVILSGRSAAAAVAEPGTLSLMLFCLIMLGMRRKMNASE